ncbi:HD domain-containing protein [Paludibacter sp.]|uniref:HD domain-containing protein n=1 Tax=Paludibacter sp. TaxID=1898105 RepID=UPI001352858F|nr:HD domain-containing protein [Paludibacter sp.]MTK52649.1 HD domain-containing protein [Paludibacter sp.]
MDQQEIIDQTATFIKKQLSGESSGHDWWHVYRVWKSAVHIGKQEQTNLFVVELAALLHDIADWKFHDGNDEVGPQRAAEWLQTLHVDDATIAHVCDIIRHISFKGAGVTTAMQTIEGKVVQDADRLDAIGAIGIARTFAYGGSKGREMYNPDVSPLLHDSFEAYKQNQSHTINHFYEKLLLLKERMNTATARQLAEQRHRVMEDYLNQFYREWDGEA